jgi:DNA polymerase (family 10)
MKNAEVARLLEEIADLLEMKGETPFKVRAYRDAARRIEGLSDNVAKLAEENRLTDIRGIGTSIAAKISEFVKTGRSTYLEELTREFPEGMAELLEIPGVGAKKARLFYEKLGISTVEQLEEAAKTHRLMQLPGIQEKTEQNVLQGIQRLKQAKGRMLLGVALPAAEEIIRELRAYPSAQQVEVGGSIRRMKETIGDIDILAASDKPEDLINAFVSLSPVKSVLARGTTRASVLTDANLQIDLRVVSPDQWGAAMQYFTGSKEHNVQLRAIAENRGLRINEYGVFRTNTNERIAGSTEEEVYRTLGMDWIPPEIRESSGEIEAAMEGRLPHLVKIDDIRGDMHAHTNWSDGSDTVEAMAEAARALGYEYLTISDHSVSMTFIKGLTVERVREQRRIIDRLNEHFEGFRLLHGIEVNIRSDGTLDYPDEILAEFDVVTASIHSGLGQSRQQITQRMLSAIQNPHVDIIGHPSGRLINKRDPSEFDAETVFTAAAKTGTALEVNAQPDRLDLRDVDVRSAIESGVTVAIDSDAHSTAQLELIRYGIATARRGWVEPQHVLNALPLDKLMERLGINH